MRVLFRTCFRTNTCTNRYWTRAQTREWKQFTYEERVQTKSNTQITEPS